MANGATTGFLSTGVPDDRSSSAEWNASTRAQLEGNYYWGGKPFAYYTTAADTGAAVGTHFEDQNYLGTERMRTMPTGPYNSSAPNYAVEATFAEQPFGDNKQTFPGTVIETSFDTDANHYAFLDSDKETATDHADFRQYSNAQGRWMAPDPYDGSYDPSNPQSLNRYVYSNNSPLSYTDSKGENPDQDGYGNCLMDGSPAPCNVVFNAMQMGAAVQCPGNVCNFRFYTDMFGGMTAQYACIGNDCDYFPGSTTTAQDIADMNSWYPQDQGLDQQCDGQGECAVPAANNTKAPGKGTKWGIIVGCVAGMGADNSEPFPKKQKLPTLDPRPYPVDPLLSKEAESGSAWDIIPYIIDMAKCIQNAWKE